jgi:hypothetical protein
MVSVTSETNLAGRCVFLQDIADRILVWFDRSVSAGLSRVDSIERRL